MSLKIRRFWMFHFWFGRQFWSKPTTVAVRSKYGRSTCVTIMPTFCEAKSCDRRSAVNVRPTGSASSAMSTPYFVEPKLPLAFTAAVMSPAPKPSSVGPPTRRV
jgi:hypothetical protein